MKVITSFSYKGGAGRTVASVNIAAALASKGANGAITRPLNRKVALLDLDVFSAGTHRALEISNFQIANLPCVQDYLLQDMKVGDYISKGGIRFGGPEDIMATFRTRGADRNCLDEFTIFPAKPDPDRKFSVQKYHENQLLALIVELEKMGFDYLILDGESGVRSMADIALRLADMVLMFFRLTWQHIEGTLETAKSLLNQQCPCYLIPTCVPYFDGVYEPHAPGLKELKLSTETVPEKTDLNEKAAQYKEEKQYGYFWDKRICVHDSLILKGSERVLVYDPDPDVVEDRAAHDYYQIADELDKLCFPQRSQ